MYQKKSIFRYRVLFLPLIAFLLIAVVYGLRKQAPQGPADPVPILCHREPDVGLLFITIENRGSNAGPSTTTLEFNTNSSTLQSNGARSRVRLEVKTSDIPAGAEVWVAAELPSTRGAGFIQPAGKITITTASLTPGISNTLVTSCDDHT